MPALDPAQLEIIRAACRDEAAFAQVMAIITSQLTNTPAPTDTVALDSPQAGTLFDELGTLILILDAEGHVIRFNRACETLTGYKTEDVRGKSIWEVFAPEHAPDRVRRYFMSIRPRTQSAVSEWAMADGRLRTVQWNARTVTDAQNRPKFIVWSGYDITEQVRAETALRTSESRYRLLMTHMNEGLIIEDLHDDLSFVNPKLCDMLGYTQIELLRRPVTDFLAPEEQAKYTEHLLKRRTGQSSTYEMVWRDKQDRPVWTITSSAPILDDRGEYQGSFGVVTDITSRKRAEEALRESEAQYRLLVTHMNDGLGIEDVDGHWVYVNDKMCQMLGYSIEELIGEPVVNCIAPDGLKLYQKQQVLRRQGKAGVYELVWACKDGSRLWTIVSADALSNEQGNFQGSMAVFTDITTRKKAEETLRNSEERYRLLLDLFPEAILVHHKGIIRFINGAGATLLGYETPEDAIGQSLLGHIHPAYKGLAESRFRRVQEAGEAVEKIEQQWLNRTGMMIDVETVAVPIFYEDHVMSQVVAHDIRERKQARKALEDSEKRLRAITSTLGEGVYVLDRKGRLTFMNPEAEHLLGWTEAELKGKAVHAIFHRHSNGDEDECPVLRSTQSGETYRIDDDSFIRRDNTLMPVAYVSTALVEDDQVVGSVTAFHDITERKQAEEEREKLIAELDAFAGTVAHDLKNPLNLIINHAEAVASFTDTLDHETRHRYLKTIVKNSNKMNTIINELLVLASVSGSEVVVRPLDMPRIISEALQSIAHLDEIEGSQLNLPREWPVALGHAPWVEEVWANYISNGLKYGGSPPRLEVGANEQDNGFVRFWIKDQGDGLTDEEQSRLFVPFTRIHTNVRAKGHGLGLSIVRRIIEKLGGEVGVESEKGQGSLFYFTLPKPKQ